MCTIFHYCIEYRIILHDLSCVQYYINTQSKTLYLQISWSYTKKSSIKKRYFIPVLTTVSRDKLLVYTLCHYIMYYCVILFNEIEKITTEYVFVHVIVYRVTCDIECPVISSDLWYRGCDYNLEEFFSFKSYNLACLKNVFSTVFYRMTANVRLFKFILMYVCSSVQHIIMRVYITFESVLRTNQY